jgi:SAM-dependent methyltransferase
MAKSRIRIHSELSAQRRSHPSNPALKKALDFVREARPKSEGLGRVADLACGKLRHYDLLLPFSDELYLVDTHEQLSATRVDAGQEYCVRDVAKVAREEGEKVHALPSSEFATSSLNLDLVVCIAALDVVLARTRSEMINSASRNLSPGGLLVVVVPRNDSTILKRCGPANAYSDGYVFHHHGAYTFFRNFRDYSPIVKACRKAGLELKKDLSCYRQVCLVFCAGGCTYEKS